MQRPGSFRKAEVKVMDMSTEATRKAFTSMDTVMDMDMGMGIMESM
jgi:hypothetical protein